MRLAALLAATAAATACGPTADAPWAPPQATLPSAAPASDAPPVSGPLRLLRILPPPGSEVEPQLSVTLVFDRPVAPPEAPARMLTFAYVDPRAVFIEDPFRLTSVWRGASGTTLEVLPPELLVGREVRLVVHGGVIRALDGSVLPGDPADPAGAAAVVSYHVLELPR